MRYFSLPVKQNLNVSHLFYERTNKFFEVAYVTFMGFNSIYVTFFGMTTCSLLFLVLLKELFYEKTASGINWHGIGLPGESVPHQNSTNTFADIDYTITLS